MKNCTLLWREADLDVKMLKTSVLERFWKLRFRSQTGQNGTKHTRFGPLLEVEMMKKCTALWDEAHFNVKMCKVQEVGSIFGS